MKKRNSKKGFTLVELVIVIAVIAILASVLIPTFGGIIDKANKSAAEQEAANMYKQLYVLDMADGELDGKIDKVDGSLPGSYVTIDSNHTAQFISGDWLVTVKKGTNTTVTYTKGKLQ